jgi:hypothetical protein
MPHMLILMVMPVFVFGCAASGQRPEFSRAESRESKAVTAPAREASGPTPRPESRGAALSAPTGRGTLSTDSSRAQSPSPPIGSAGGREEKAAEHREAAAEKQVFEGITGLVMSETMTKIGNEFFEQFCLLWEPPTSGLSGYNVIISEKASPMWGAWITVSVDDVPIWSKVLPPRSEEIEPEVEEARAIVYEYVSNYEQYQLQTEDMAGTGF